VPDYSVGVQNAFTVLVIAEDFVIESSHEDAVYLAGMNQKQADASRAFRVVSI
jgi:hypothetical protein